VEKREPVSVNLDGVHLKINLKELTGKDTGGKGNKLWPKRNQYIM
jgi:hypothetical protein